MTTKIKESKFHIFGGNNRHSDYIDPSPIKWITGGKYGLVMPAYFNEHAQLKRWCEQNCKDVVAYEVKGPPLSGAQDEIYFFLEEDAVAFKLRWL